MVTGTATSAIGIPNWDSGSVTDGGAVLILHGSSSGLTGVVDDDLIFQGLAGVVDGTFESDDRFGEALAVGDFDDDGYDDLLVGVPGEDLSGGADAGAVHVFYGSASGLELGTDEVWSEADSGITGNDEAGERVRLGAHRLRHR